MKKKFNIIFKINMYVLFLIMFFFTTNLVYAVAQSRYIAEVDSVKYDDYEDAWDEAVSSGKEIKMLSDWIIDDVLSIDSSKTVNLTMNGYMINRGRTSSTSSGQIFNVKKSATLNIIGGGNNEHRGVILSSGVWRSNENGQYIINGSLITGGFNSNGGGAFHIQENATVNLTQVTIAGNSSSDSLGGGAIRLHGDNSKLYMINSQILYNKSTKSGGAGISLEGVGSYAQINNCQIMHNLTDGEYSSGGAIQVNNGKVVVLNKSEISYNSSSSSGGGVYIKNGEFLINDNSVIISYNNAKTSGGAIYVDSGADNVVLAGDFIGNNAEIYGGAIYINQDKITRINDSNFYGNIASCGGAIYVENDHYISLYGKIIMSGNTPNSLYLMNKYSILIAELQEGSLIGIDAPLDFLKTNSICVSGDNVRYFVSDREGYEININSNELYFVENTNTTPTSYIVDSQTFQLKTGSFIYNGITIGNTKSKYYYSDGYFYGSSSLYNEHLSTMSVNLFLSSVPTEFGDREYSEEVAAENAVDLLEKIGFTNIYIHYPYPTYYGNDKDIISTIGYIIASKTITVNNIEETLIAVCVRGAGYGAEWASNVTIGDGIGEAKGFSDAATQVEKGIEEYIKIYGIDDNQSKYWLTGFSRSAATANLTSKRLTDKYGMENVFSYCFETPKGGVLTTIEKGSSYSNIHNIINDSDVVPMVATTEMGFIRYGIDHIMPSYGVGTKEYNIQKDKMLSQLSVLNNSISFNDYYHAATLDYFWSYITGSNLLNEIDWQYLNAADFISFFISEFQKRSFTDTSEDNEYNNESNNWQGYRHFYSSYTWYMQYSDSDLKIVSSGVIPSDYIGNEDKYITMTFEEAICNLMGLFFNMTDEQKTSLTSNLSMDAIKEDLSMYDIWTEVIDEWEHMSLKNKNAWLIKIWNALKIDSISNDIISKDDKKTIKHSAYVALDLLLDFVADDYEYNDQNVVGTLVYNITNILQTHRQEVVASWIRSYDSFYLVDYVAPPYEPVSNITPGIYNESLEIELSAEDNTKIYYTIDGTLPVIGKENTFEYTGSIKLSLVDSDIKSYVINAISITDNIKSEVSTFHYYISDNNGFTTDFIVSDVTYNDELLVSVDSKFGDVIYLYSDTIDGEFTDVKPINPGIYYVKAIVEGNDYYGQIESEIKSFEIKKIEIDLSNLTWENESYIYDGTPKIVTLEGVILDDELIEITYEENEFINVGEYITTANIILYKPEYYVIINSPNLTYNWKIEVAQNAFIEEVTIANWEYGQNASIPTGESKFGEVYFLYSDSIDGDYKSTTPTIPGQYYLKGCVDGSSNYMGICSDVIEFEILKNKNTFVIDLSISNWVYEANPILEVNSLYGDVIVLYSNSIDGEFTTTVPKNAGIYYVKAIVEETTYYTSLESEIITVEILKATNEFLENVSISSWTYGETPNNPTAISKYGDVIFTYSTSIDGTYTDVKPTNAGVYYLKTTVLEDINYYGLETINQFEIIKANPIVSVPTDFIVKKGSYLSSILLPDNWSWNEPTMRLNSIGKIQVLATYTPDDFNNYNSIEMLIEIEVVENNDAVVSIFLALILVINVIPLEFIINRKKYNLHA